jgi:glucokinase
MTLLGIDLGGTKLATALFSSDGLILSRNSVLLNGRSGGEVGKLVTSGISNMIDVANSRGLVIDAIGVSVPGISNLEAGTVWAPNIKGWTEYPLFGEIRTVAGPVPVIIEGDRACHIMGEVWMGNARGCRNVVFLAVGTGIGAGILSDGVIVRGNNDISGAIGWMALNRPFNSKYEGCGCFEYHASGEGLVKVAYEFMAEDDSYSGELRTNAGQRLTAHDLFRAFNNGDPLAQMVINQAVEYWGMAVANIVSLLNPEKIIFGGGIFGPAAGLTGRIKEEASKWAQPVSIKKVSVEVTHLGEDAGLYGAAYLALGNLGKNPG